MSAIVCNGRSEHWARENGGVEAGSVLSRSTMQSKATTVASYLASLPADRRAAIETVRKVIRANLDLDIEEGMQYGMIRYSVPHRVYPAGYHCDARQPLPFAGLASQKNYMSVYLMCVYCSSDTGVETPYARWFRQAWAKTGKKLDMGKACVRFRRVEDLALDVLDEALRRETAKSYIEEYERVIGRTAPKAARAKSAARPAKSKASKNAGVKRR
jgi:hypothetical protein